MAKIRTLIVDDSALMRRTLRQIVEQDPELELVAIARDGIDGLAKARELHPDVISMDINMPQMDGITALQHIMAEHICPVVMVSSLTQKGAVTTFEAMELGAFDYVGKPDGTVSSDMSSVARELVSKLKLAARTGSMKRLSGSAQRRKEKRVTAAAVLSPPPRTVANAFGYKAVALGISTGGPSTLMEVLPLLPKDLPMAMFLVQHMPASFITSFANRLRNSCAIKVVEAQGGMTVEPGTCYVAQGDRQLILMQKLSGEVVIRTPAYPPTLFMPSVGVMMESVLGVYGRGTIGVLMTGIGDDGADAMVKVKMAGGHTIAESEETAVVFGMPREAAERGGACVVTPSYGVAQEIIEAI
jgi:two-component system, chemotaxis family, protein-glutamate methylesterase/glutaminase